MKNDKKGYDRLWNYFGLSYASWLTMPRVLMHEMPDSWQLKMAKLLEEYDNYWDTDKLLDEDFPMNIFVMEGKEIDCNIDEYDEIEEPEEYDLKSRDSYFFLREPSEVWNNYRHPQLDFNKLKENN